MKENYLEIYDRDFETAKKNFCEDLTNEIKGISVNSKVYGDGTIEAAESLNNTTYIPLDIIITINFTDVIKKFCVFTAMHSNFITMADKDFKIFEAVQEELDRFTNKIEDDRHAAFEENRRIFAEKQAAKKKAEHDKRMESKRKSTQASAIRAVEKLKALSPDEVDDFYVCLGWIAKHTKNIEARLPDFLDSWFIKEFGDVQRRVIDSSKITSGGNLPQWTLSIKITIDTNDNMPASLIDMLGEESKKTRPISRTDYVYTLCKEYGFKFGKEQDLDAILDCIPSDKLDSFNFGMSF